MLVKTNEKTKSGRSIYINELTGRKQILQRVSGRSRTKIPDYVFGTFKKPANTFPKVF